MSDGIPSDQLRGHLETLVLSLLEERSSHGFELVKRFEERGSGLLRLREATVYPVLYRLERQGLVKARWEEGESDRRGPRRRIYSLTAKGKRQLQSGRAEWARFVMVIGPLVGAPA